MKFCGSRSEICPDCDEFDCKCGGVEMNDFSKAQINDKVYSLRWGCGTVAAVDDGAKGAYQLLVLFEDGGNRRYLYSGKTHPNHFTPDLYWDVPEIIAPPRPKRLVRKTEVFNNVKWVKYRKEGIIVIYPKAPQKGVFGDLYGRIPQGGKCRLTIEYEVEE